MARYHFSSAYFRLYLNGLFNTQKVNIAFIFTHCGIQVTGRHCDKTKLGDARAGVFAAVQTTHDC